LTLYDLNKANYWKSAKDVDLNKNFIVVQPFQEQCFDRNIISGHC
jgi:hypothetical protein